MGVWVWVGENEILDFEGKVLGSGAVWLFPAWESCGEKRITTSTCSRSPGFKDVSHGAIRRKGSWMLERKIFERHRPEGFP